ncbi:MAG: hypothetical protein EA415_03775 [Sphaerobacteraceae bacterium]|nr:MAG: hypothetical protein EA415_03775 [Sphaerobacteraceae bacterium]
MSTQYHQRQNAINDSSGGSGCAMFLIIAGVGLAIAAILFGAVIAFFTIDASETTTSEFVVEDEVEVVVAATDPIVTDSSADTTPASYPDRIYGLIELLRISSEDYTELKASIGERDEAWEVELLEVFATWRDVDHQIGQIVPSPTHQASYELLSGAASHYRDAADAIEPAILSGEEDPFSKGANSVNNGAIALKLAETTLADELD